MHRQGQESALPKVELLRGTGAVGVRLTAPDASEDTIGFRTDQEAPTASIGGLEITGRVLAQGKNKDGRVVRGLAYPGQEQGSSE